MLSILCNLVIYKSQHSQFDLLRLTGTEIDTHENEKKLHMRYIYTVYTVYLLYL